MEMLLKGDWQNGVVYDPESDGCEARVNGECIKWHKLSSVCERALCAAGVVLDAPLPVEPVTTIERTSKGRCAHYKAIRRAFAIATEQGLDTKADAAMRRSFAMFLRHDVPSRESLSGGEWMLLGNAMKRHQLW